MPAEGSKLVRNDIENSVKDYTDLLEEMEVLPHVQEEVFEIIKQFPNTTKYLLRIRQGTEASHRYLNNLLFGHTKRAKLGDIEGISGLLKNLLEEDKKDEALASLIPIMNRLWLRMRDTIFEDATTEAYLEKVRAKNAKKQPTRTSRKPTELTLSSSSSTVVLNEQRDSPAMQHDICLRDFETYNAQMTRLLKAVLDPLLPPTRAAAPVIDPSLPRTRAAAPTTNSEDPVGRPSTTTPRPRRSTRIEAHAGLASTDLVAASSVAHGTTGMDRAWQAAEEMMRKRQASSDGDRGEFLLVYSAK